MCRNYIKKNHMIPKSAPVPKLEDDAFWNAAGGSKRSRSLGNWCCVSLWKGPSCVWPGLDVIDITDTEDSWPHLKPVYIICDMMTTLHLILRYIHFWQCLIMLQELFSRSVHEQGTSLCWVLAVTKVLGIFHSPICRRPLDDLLQWALNQRWLQDRHGDDFWRFDFKLFNHQQSWHDLA